MIGGGTAASDYSVICAESIRVGDVIGATHTFRHSWISTFSSNSVTVVKTELWNEGGEAMFVSIGVQPSLFVGTINPRIQRITDFDIDSFIGAGATNETTFDQTGSTGFVSNTGPVSDVSVGWGDCSSAGKVGSLDAWFTSSTPTEDLCNPRDWTADRMTIYDLEASPASVFDPAQHGYVLTIGDSPSAAEALWNDTAADYCGELWEASSSGSFPGGMCNGTIIWEPSDPVDPSL